MISARKYADRSRLTLVRPSDRAGPEIGDRRWGPPKKRPKSAQKVPLYPSCMSILSVSTMRLPIVSDQAGARPGSNRGVVNSLWCPMAFVPDDK